jgi:methylmalonyl-CoA mutase N-terminal domain/subunit
MEKLKTVAEVIALTGSYCMDDLADDTAKTVNALIDEIEAMKARLIVLEKKTDFLGLPQ